MHISFITTNDACDSFPETSVTWIWNQNNPATPRWAALTAHSLPGRGKATSLKNTRPASIQAWNKSSPINVRVNVLIHWSDVVAIQFGVLRSRPQIMRFLCTWWLHRTASQKQRWLRLQDMAYDGPVASIAFWGLLLARPLSPSSLLVGYRRKPKDLIKAGLKKFHLISFWKGLLSLSLPTFTEQTINIRGRYGRCSALIVKLTWLQMFKTRPEYIFCS